MKKPEIERLIEESEIQNVMERAQVTLSQMMGLAGVFVWDVCPPESFEAKVKQIAPETENLNGQRTAQASEEQHAEREWRRLLKDLHKATVTALEVARVAWEEDPERSMIVAPLRASGQSPVPIMEEAEELEVAWEEIDPAWVAVDRVSLPQLQGKIAQTRAAQRTWRQVAAKLRRSQARLAVAVQEVDRLAKRWYKVATALFGPETPEGETLRRSIPTTYQPRQAEAAKRRRHERKAAAGGVA